MQIFNQAAQEISSPVLPEGSARRLADLTTHLATLTDRLAEKYPELKMPEVSLSLLTEADFHKDLEQTRDPLRRFQLVALLQELNISFNPYVTLNHCLDFLAHELGHCILTCNSNFEPEPYLPDGRMGSRRALHEEVAKHFQREGRDLLRDVGLTGNKLSNWIARQRIIQSMLSLTATELSTDTLRIKEGIEISEVVLNPEEILEKYPEYFKPRYYEEL